MTVEEAIRELQNIATYDIDSQRGKDKYDAIDMAIKALEQQPCEDCISRQAVLDIDFEKIILTTARPAEMIEQKIRALPPVTPQPTRWIPVSERPPEYGEPVLTWDGNCYFVEKRIPCVRDEDGEPILSDWWVSDDYDESESEYYPNLRDGACIAWMPLPEPYKAESEE